MKDLRFRRLERHRVGGSRDRMQLSYEPPRSPSGKVYHYSPNPDAVPRLFLLGDAPESRRILSENQKRIRRQPGPGETICPYSGFEAPDDDFIHADDIEAIKKIVGWEAAADVQDYLAGMARDFNRRQPRNSFLKISMDVKPRRNQPKPAAIREDLLRDLECDVCQRSYAVYAIALFCPDCGAANVALHFTREVELVSEQVRLAEAQQKADNVELAYRLMGNAHEDVLTAFETTLKTVYRHLVRVRFPGEVNKLCSKSGVGNAFQNIARIRQKFSHLNLDPFSVLSGADLEFMKINIQKRHVIGHNLGVADEYYGELIQREKPGETVSLIGEEIRRFAEIALSVVTGFEREFDPEL